MSRRVLLALGLLCGALACNETTGGALIRMPFRVGGLARSAAGPLNVQTPSGWNVELDVARIALGPFYFNVESQSSEQYRNGTFIMQATQQLIVDPLDPTLVTLDGGVDGETGTAISAEIDLLPLNDNPEESEADRTLLGSHLAVMGGTATRTEADGGVTTVSFQGPIDVDKSKVTPQTPLAWLQRVPGASVNLQFTGNSQVLEMRVDPSSWLDIDYAALTTKDAAGRFTWAPNSTQGVQLFGGVTTTVGVYNFDLVSNSR